MFRSPVVTPAHSGATGARMRSEQSTPTTAAARVARDALADLRACRDNPAAAQGWRLSRIVLRSADLLRDLDPRDVLSRLLSDRPERQETRGRCDARQASPPPDDARSRARRLVAAPAAPPAAVTGCPCVSLDRHPKRLAN